MNLLCVSENGYPLKLPSNCVIFYRGNDENKPILGYHFFSYKPISFLIDGTNFYGATKKIQDLLPLVDLHPKAGGFDRNTQR